MGTTMVAAAIAVMLALATAVSGSAPEAVPSTTPAPPLPAFPDSFSADFVMSEIVGRGTSTLLTGSGEIYVDSDGNRARTTTLKWVDQKPSKTTVDTLALYDDNVEYVTVEDGSGAANCTKVAVENGFAYNPFTLAKYGTYFRTLNLTTSVCDMYMYARPESSSIVCMIGSYPVLAGTSGLTSGLGNLYFYQSMNATAPADSHFTPPSDCGGSDSAGARVGAKSSAAVDAVYGGARADMDIFLAAFREATGGPVFGGSSANAPSARPSPGAEAKAGTGVSGDVDPNVMRLWETEQLNMDFVYTFDDLAGLPYSSDISIDHLNNIEVQKAVVGAVLNISEMLISYGKGHMDEPWQTQRLADLEAVSALYAGYAAQLAMGDKVVIPKYYHALPEYWFKVSLEEGGVPAIGGDYSFYGAWLSTATEAAYGPVAFAFDSTSEIEPTSPFTRQAAFPPFSTLYFGPTDMVSFFDPYGGRALASIVYSNASSVPSLSDAINDVFTGNRSSIAETFLDLLTPISQSQVERDLVSLGRIYSTDRANALLEWVAVTEPFAADSGASPCMAYSPAPNSTVVSEAIEALEDGEVIYSSVLLYMVVDKANDTTYLWKLTEEPSAYSMRTTEKVELTDDLMGELLGDIHGVYLTGYKLSSAAVADPGAFMQALANGDVTATSARASVDCKRACNYVDGVNPGAIKSVCTSAASACATSLDDGSVFLSDNYFMACEIRD